MHPYNIAILGAGPGGYVAALRARQLGLKVALIEDQDVGGVCLNWGCIPTKALLKSAEMLSKAQQMEAFGVHVGRITADLHTMVNRSRQVVQRLTDGVSYLLKKNKVDVIRGRGHLEGRQGDLWCVKSGAQSVLAAHVIFATGARPKTFLPPDLGVWTARQAMVATDIPKTLLIIGAGAIGIEFASFYAALGTKVCVVEQGHHILPAEDLDISAMAHQIFVQKGMEILLNHGVHKVRVMDHGFEADVVDHNGKKSRKIQAEKVLMAIGVTGNVENLGLESTQVQVKNGAIVTHGCSQTHEPGLYAIGDVAGGPTLAHKASHEGVRCVEFIAGLNPEPVDKDKIPGCIYSFPQIASLGLTESQATDRGLSIKVGQFSFGGNGQALAQGNPQGTIKVIFEQSTGQFLGAHMIGSGVSEMIGPFVALQNLEGCLDDFERFIFPHPTMSEALHEAILAAEKRSLHS